MPDAVLPRCCVRTITCAVSISSMPEIASMRRMSVIWPTLTSAGTLLGMEAMVLCHMAPNPAGYQTPPPAFDTNVKGTANLYHAAVEQAIPRCVLISTIDVIDQPHASSPFPGDGPYNYQCGLYGLTKQLQEDIARYYYEKHHIATAILRPGWIIYDQDFITKYGWQMDHYEPTLIDPRDIGSAVADRTGLA